MVAVWDFLLWPLGAPSNRGSDLGSSLIAGTIIAVAILFLELRFAQRQQKRDLQLQLALGDEFPGIDLRGADLSGSYLVGKNLREAKFQGANLRGTNLSDTNLINARFDGADLRSAIMYEPPLYPSEELLPGEDVFPSDGLPDAIINGAIFEGAWYDDATKWPSNIDEPEALGAIKAGERVSWGRRLFVG
jgi:uncharacterized protein YjbI with pentapeptide repeats